MVVLLLAQPALVVAQPVLVVAPPEVVVAPPEVAPPEVLAEALASPEVQLLVMGEAVLTAMSMVGQKQQAATAVHPAMSMVGLQQQQATAVHLWELWDGSGPASSS